ncbi:hypothetical protein [Sulfobacillus harzensis]|uniref:Uncharacterized protein n=1 Tax=Sulfobacillus harzensis TaxID=2729629 RepID=A0A7Y0Q441_9FIRM|nr:hypothetical protein [Sulfobacillus harzensis]NMP23626.1 hypothetical protein [Sulfobacillus harzensis]
MVTSRSPIQSPKSAPGPRLRANPVGLGRLLILVLTMGLLSLGQGFFWWMGLLLLALILLAASRQGAWWAPWASSAGLLALAFWHRHVLAPWMAIVILVIGALGFALGLLNQRPD